MQRSSPFCKFFTTLHANFPFPFSLFPFSFKHFLFFLLRFSYFSRAVWGGVFSNVEQSLGILRSSQVTMGDLAAKTDVSTQFFYPSKCIFQRDLTEVKSGVSR
jgi:hypothetical protein